MFLNRKLLLLALMLCCVPERIPAADFTVVSRLRSADCAEVPQARLELLRELQKDADRLTPKEFAAYRKAADEEARNMEGKSRTLAYYDAAFDKILAEVKSFSVASGTMMIWHVYNMGYVIKTPKQCFAIDLYHRRAAELAPYLDFLLVTHRHGDHRWNPLFDEMAKAGKPVVSNFLDNEWKADKPGEFQFGEITIHTNQVDHNKKLLRFVNIYQIDCGASAGGCVLLHTGDACNPAQFELSKKIDVFIPHIRVGMNIENAVKNYVRPDYVLMSHVLELGHPVGRARWSYQNGLDDCRKVHSCANVWMPVWGERFSWEGVGRTLSPLP